MISFLAIIHCISFFNLKRFGRSWDSSVSIAKGLQAGRPRFDSRQCKIFLFSTASRPTLEPTQPPIQWVPGALSLGVKQQGHQADHLPPSSAKVMEGGAIPPLHRLHGIVLNKLSTGTTLPYDVLDRVQSLRRHLK
jgi:hypothetical protein